MTTLAFPGTGSRIEDARRQLARLRRNLGFRLARREDSADLLRLRVLRGRHSGAHRTFADGAAILVGSSSDCDIALCDPGIAAHHCLLTISQGAVTARDIDERVRLERRQHRPQGASRAATWWRVDLADDVVLALGPAAQSGWDALPAESPRPRPVPRRGLAIAAGAAGLAVLTATIAVPRNEASLPAVEQTAPAPQSVQTILATLGLDDVQLRTAEDGSSELHGIVPSAAALDGLQRALEQREVAIALEVRVGEVIARDVREVLRLSGITAKTRYLGAGEVEVRGDFPLDEQLQSIVASRAMREIDRLAGVTVANADGSAKVPPGKSIVAVVRGADPYVVTADGSRYYVGAVLPSGDTLQEINGDEVLVVKGTETRRLVIKDKQSDS